MKMSNVTIELDGVRTPVDPDAGYHTWLNTLPEPKRTWLVAYNNLKRQEQPQHYTRDQWDRELEVRLLTGNQLSAIMNNFYRLGFHPQHDRSERLDLISQLVGRDISSTYELKQGEAGYLISQLLKCHTPEDLVSLLHDQEPKNIRRVVIGLAVLLGGAAAIYKAMQS